MPAQSVIREAKEKCWGKNGKVTYLHSLWEMRNILLQIVINFINFNEQGKDMYLIV